MNDLHRFDAFLKITCQKCGHEAAFEGSVVEAYFRDKRWSTAWECIAQRFKCSECGSKEVKAGMKARPILAPDPRPPRPV